MAEPVETSTLSLARFGSEAKGVVVGAQSLADERRHSEVQPLHLLSVALRKNPSLTEVFRRAGAEPNELVAAAERALAALPRSNEPAYLSAGAVDLLSRAEREANRERHSEVELEDLLNALSQELRGPLGELFGAFRIGPGTLRPHLSILRGGARSPVEGTVPSAAGGFVRSLVAQARSGAEPPIVGRASELRRVLTVLERRTKCHPLLVGEPGVGKRAVVAELSRRLAGGDVPTSLSGADVLELDAGSLLSGTRLRGEIEERSRKLLARFSGNAEPAILFVPSIEQLFGTNPALGALADLLRAALERGELRLLGTTTPDGLKRFEERDAELLRSMTPLVIDEPSLAEATEILRAVAGRLAAHHGVAIAEGAVSSAVTLAQRYLQDRRLPESAIDLLDETAARKRVTADGLPEAADVEVRRLESVEAQLTLRRTGAAGELEPVRVRLEDERRDLLPRVENIRAATEARRGGVAAVRALRAELAQLEKATPPAAESAIRDLEARLARAEEAVRGMGLAADLGPVEAEDVALTLAAWTAIPVQRMLEGEAERLLGLEDRLRDRVVGQDHALSAIGRAIRRGRVGLRDPRRPIGSFLFMGPSGVGKTELAKALATLLFDDERALTRLDMSEFMERHMAQRLIGAPPGYADSEQGGFLTEAVRRRPYSVLLFDEVEKAHQDVFNLLLQLLDDGRLTDGRGRTADFSNTVVILTSNIGSERILETDPRLFETEDGQSALRDVLLDRLREFFRPELLNRIDELLVFRPLGKAQLGRIVELELRGTARWLAERGLELRVSDAAKARLVDLGYEPALGARPVKRTILRQVQDPLAEALLAGKLSGPLVAVELEGDAVVLRNETAAREGTA
jgi:ATP-dependent Clp protease ATP-binding subunit ClpB